MLTIRVFVAGLILFLALGGIGWGMWQYQSGWREGRNALLTEQAEAAEKLRQENTHRQQVEDTKAAAVEKQGEAKTVTITREVVRYVQTPGRNVCQFDDRRLRIKADAVANASNIPGFDGEAVPDGNASK